MGVETKVWVEKNRQKTREWGQGAKSGQQQMICYKAVDPTRGLKFEDNKESEDRLQNFLANLDNTLPGRVLIKILFL